jgi:hypothetical protein
LEKSESWKVRKVGKSEKSESRKVRKSGKSEVGKLESGLGLEDRVGLSKTESVYAHCSANQYNFNISNNRSEGFEEVIFFRMIFSIKRTDLIPESSLYFFKRE